MKEEFGDDNQQEERAWAAAREAQLSVCQRFGVEPLLPVLGTKVGIALQTRGVEPLNAMRTQVEGGTCGWYIFWGPENTGEPEFFQPLHVEHLVNHCQILLPYLALPPGWWVQLAPGHEDVWFDPTSLEHS